MSKCTCNTDFFCMLKNLLLYFLCGLASQKGTSRFLFYFAEICPGPLARLGVFIYKSHFYFMRSPAPMTNDYSAEMVLIFGVWRGVSLPLCAWYYQKPGVGIFCSCKVLLFCMKAAWGYARKHYPDFPKKAFNSFILDKNINGFLSRNKQEFLFYWTRIAEWYT